MPGVTTRCAPSLVMRARATRVMRAAVASTRIMATVVPNPALGSLARPTMWTPPQTRAWLREPPLARCVMTTRLKSTGRDAPPLDPDSAHDRALAAARAVEETLAGTPGRAFEETDFDRAKAQILRFLNYKPRTRQELMTKLVEDKLYDPDVARRAIDHLQDKGVHSDVDYAEQWARYKWRTAKWAPWRIRTSLREKGVADRDSNEGLSRVFDNLGDVRVRESLADDDNNDDDERKEVAIAGEEEDKGAELVRAARRRWQLSRGLPQTTRRRRLSAWLERRGHRAGVARDIISTLEGEDRRRQWEEEAEEEAAALDDETMS